MKVIYKEVMLNGIIHEKFNKIRFKFYDSTTGEDLKCIICKGVLLLNYSSTILPYEEVFPYFVLDITEEKIEREDIEKYLNSSNFSFHLFNGSLPIPEMNFYSIFKVQGGEIDIMVICLETEW